MPSKRGFMCRSLDPLPLFGVAGGTLPRVPTLRVRVALLLCLASITGAHAKCPIPLFEIQGEARAGERVAFFVGDEPSSGGFDSQHQQVLAADGPFRLRVQHSATKSWVRGRCRFPDHGVLVIASDTRPWRRIRVELPRAMSNLHGAVVRVP
jgi:hypothetical protein